MLCQGNGGHLGTPAGSKAPVPAGLHSLPSISSLYNVLWQLWRVIIQGSILYNSHPSFFSSCCKAKALEGWAGIVKTEVHIYTWILYLFSHNTHNTFLLKSCSIHKSYFSLLPLGTAAGVTWVVIISRSAIWCWAEPKITSKSIREQLAKLAKFICSTRCNYKNGADDSLSVNQRAVVNSPMPVSAHVCD